MTVKRGREQIQKLVNEAIDKYVSEGGDPFTRNNTLENYEGFAKKLNKLSRHFPEFGLEKIEDNSDDIDDQDNKWQITTGQIREACLGKVENLKDYFYESLHWYLYKKPSREVEPVPRTVVDQPTVVALNEQITAYKTKIADYESQITGYQKPDN